ncbi:response regulator [Lutibacter sp. A80]|uniref:hybrid sensor histidine kinase/response regulator transcription factor n=1 Tax=Lutibacter sp. A80 TaxID=2918453 RepID=UPI001F0620BA|nr:hybrid sensor histidine kinase/response regulator transcription factor [Lutibacter sp. A80]UMB60283.1 response regulator [Lutibacter sp. A80]
MKKNSLINPHNKKNTLLTTFLIVFLLLNSLISIGQEHSNFIHIEPVYNKKVLNISNIIEDNYGYIWMSYASGFLKYDGSNYYPTDINDIFKDRSSDDFISNLQKDFKNNIWISTRNGLVRICDTLGNFNELDALKGKKIQLVSTTSKESVLLATKQGEIYSYNYTNPQLEKITTIPDIAHNVSEILNIVTTDNGELFISTDKGKIFQYSPKNYKLSTLDSPFSDFPGNIKITKDLSNKLWIGTESYGLFVYDINSKKFIQETLFKAPFYNIKKEMFIRLYCDSKGYIWAGTDGGGLYKVDSNHGIIQLYTHQNTNKFSLRSNSIIAIYEDSHENIWVASNYGGLNILPEVNNKIKYYDGSDTNTPSRILSIYKTKNGTIWAGTDGTGITKITPNKDGTTSKKQYFSTNKLKKGFYIQSITEDNQENIWFGTYKNSLWHYNSQKNSFKNIEIKNSLNQKATDVRVVYTDSKQRIWVGSNLSLNVYSSKQKLLASFENNTHGLKGFVAESIIEDANGTIWVGYYKGGLFKFEENIKNLTNSKFEYISYYNETKYPNDILGVKSMELDELGILWLINSHGKLVKFDPNTHKYNSLQNNRLLNSFDIRAVLAENNTNLWLSTSNGILHFNFKDSATTKFQIIDGLQDNVFMSRSAIKDKETLYFGGINGFNSFKPSDITKKELKPKLYINSIEILNQPATSLIPNQINSSIEHLKKITLTPNQSSFSFRFSAFDNVLNTNYRYAYRLLGFNNTWIPVTKEQLATYTNIPSGNYTFEVKASSKNGDWDIAPKKIAIEITQPLWNTPLAHFFYLFLFIVTVLIIIKWYELKKKIISDKISYDKEKELHTLKMNFFAKMSHEIQTPLTLILSPIDSMLQRAEDNGNLLLKQRLQIISNNVKRLSRIVFELTTVRNKELERTRLLVTKNNLYEDLNDITLSFKEQARLKHIDFSLNCPQNLAEAWYDKEKIEHIIYNLLSNAFKFTPKEGNIQLIATPINNKNSIKIYVKDSGPGIEEEELNDIFTLFYQSKTGIQSKGSGIGLALTKELIEIHRGKIEVTSNSMEGTTFIITFPVTKEAYLKEERIIPELKITPDKEESIKSTPISTKKHNKTILIVEDNLELQHLLKDLLSNTYNIILTENGNEGYIAANNHHPDLILSDIMMPEVDGIEMCKMLQENKLTKHIPIILLTAKNSTKSKILGLESGAIEFINKPFNTNELLLKINNIIVSTEHIISNLKKEIINNPTINVDKSNDDIFLENLITAINSKIEDPNFRVEDLSEALSMSYSTLYRKCQALTGEGLVELVRLLRLKKAAIVIAKYGYSISEAAYISGFNDPKYFSKCFKKHFGKTPNTFKKEALQIGSEKYLKKYKLDVSIIKE